MRRLAASKQQDADRIAGTPAPGPAGDGTDASPFTGPDAHIRARQNAEAGRPAHFRDSVDRKFQYLVCTDCGGVYASGEHNAHAKTKKHTQSMNR